MARIETRPLYHRPLDMVCYYIAVHKRTRAVEQRTLSKFWMLFLLSISL